MTLYVLHKDGDMLITTTGSAWRKRTKHWTFRSKDQAEIHAKKHDAEVVEYAPKEKEDDEASKW